MMKTQTLEFNIGYAFSKIERTYINCLDKGYETDGSCVYVPKIWFDRCCFGCDTLDLRRECRVQVTKRLSELFKNIAPGWGITLSVRLEKQYVRIDYHIRKKEQPKKMTVEEIEKALGYKVEIVSE